MIFVTVGTASYPLNRLVRAADELAREGEHVVVQYGTSSVRPVTASGFDFVPARTLERYMADARVVVCHAGIGSVAACLRHGKKPILVARRRALGEQVDDHQVAFANRLVELDLATAVEDLSRLPEAVVRAGGAVAPETGLSKTLADELISFIEQSVGRRRVRTG
jgi:UDP-N-acetylglucosamine transferase subunit ALG13